MRIRVLGAAAGGGFPQWNCNCANCDGVRAGSIVARPRTQSSVAVSADGLRWYLLNASPDIGAQIGMFPPLGPPAGTSRGTGIESVLLTNADLDHTLGLLQLREGDRLIVYAGAGARDALDRGLRLSPMLEAYCGIEWRNPPADLQPLLRRDGHLSGLSFAGLALPGNPPRYVRSIGGVEQSDSLAYRVVDDSTGGCLVFIPDMACLDSEIIAAWSRCDALLIDGTFWSDDEMAIMGVGTARAQDMGHVPVGGDDGSLAVLQSLSIARKVYIHINNTNPILLGDSFERAAVEAAGVEVAYDGMEMVI
jgi:pyrroloquinoline quinone biosynthesis protein B